jgi:hypothetical protein
MRSSIVLLGCLFQAATLHASPLLTEARAQEGVGGVAESGMGQGHASVTTRSDVSVSLESVPGTSGPRIAALGRALTAAMPQIRACYAQAIQRVPVTQGRGRLRLDLPAAGAGVVTVLEDGRLEAALLRCVGDRLSALPLDASLRPASAIVVLELDSTVAHGAAEVARRQAEADAVSVSRESGRPEASGEGGAVRFAVRADPEAGDELVAEATRVVRSALPGLLDCRRRAGRRGRSPAGTLTFSVVLRGETAPSAAARGATVADPMAPRCVATAISRAHRRPALGGAVELEVSFEP